MGVLFSMIGNAWRTTRNIILVIALLVSLAVNVASFTVNVVSTAISTVFETLTGAETVYSAVRKQEVKLAAKTKEASVLRGTAAGRQLALKQVEADLAATRKLASWGKGTVAGLGLKLKRTEAARVAAELDVAAQRAGRKVMIDGLEKTVPEAVSLVTSRVRNRTVKLATADLAATAGQAIPWIGIGVVVAATAYDLDMSCQTMSDMKALDQAMNPSAADEADVSQVCGLKAPTAKQVWEEVKASPGQAWDAAASVLSGLPSVMPDLPAWWGYVVSIDWTPWN